MDSSCVLGLGGFLIHNMGNVTFFFSGTDFKRYENLFGFPNPNPHT